MECCGMKLNEFTVNGPRPGPISHGEPVPTCPGGVTRPQEDITQSPGCQNGFLCQTQSRTFGLLIEEVGSRTGARLVNGQPVKGVVGGCHEVNGRMIGQEIDVRMVLQCLYQAFLYGRTGVVLEVKDP